MIRINELITSNTNVTLPFYPDDTVVIIKGWLEVIHKTWKQQNVYVVCLNKLSVNFNKTVAIPSTSYKRYLLSFQQILTDRGSVNVEYPSLADPR